MPPLGGGIIITYVLDIKPVVKDLPEKYICWPQPPLQQVIPILDILQLCVKEGIAYNYLQFATCYFVTLVFLSLNIPNIIEFVESL